MAMAFNGAAAASKCDINVVPLIDVLLVLLIIFMVTAPIVARELVVDLPQPGPDDKTSIDEPPPIRLRIDATGALFWGTDAMPRHALAPTLRVEASRDPQAPLQLETAGDAQYQLFAEVLATARNAGMQKIGFVAP
jgi:biopolymer transport protein ExbD